MIKLIYAATHNGAIGFKNNLLFKLPLDMKRFSELTKNNVVVMGSKTYRSLPAKYRPLPNRTNKVVSSRTVVHNEVGTISDLPGYLELEKTNPYLDVWIIGGASIYNQALPYVDEIHFTLIPLEATGDTFFHIEDWIQDFELISSEAVPDTIPCLYKVYKRKKKEPAQS